MPGLNQKILDSMEPKKEVKLDPITLSRIELLHPKDRAMALEMYKEQCAALSGRAMLRYAYTLRTFKEQNDLYAIGRTKPGKKVTNAPGGKSYHNYGLAYDIVLLLDKDGNGTYESASWETNVDFDGDGDADWREVVAIAKQYGYEAGIDWAKFPDAPHFQKTHGYSVNDLLAMVNSGKVINGYVTI